MSALFFRCNGIESVTIDDQNKHFSLFDRLLLDFEGTSLIASFDPTRELQIPASIQSLNKECCADLRCGL
jgi:hypothetical protein